MSAIYLSDVHLRDAYSIKARLVIRFLQQVASRHEEIYILGDLFDAWPYTSEFLLRAFRPVLQALKKLVEEGHTVHYIEGNHDFHLGEYFREDLGIDVHPRSFVQTRNGKKIYMAHGDLANRRDIGYHGLRFVLRSNLARTLFKYSPPELLFRIGSKSSVLSRRYQSKRPRQEIVIRQVYRDAAQRIFREGYDVVLMGHTHLPDDFTVTLEGRICRYLNTGDWVKHFTYLEFDGTQFYTKTHPVKVI